MTDCYRLCDRCPRLMAEELCPYHTVPHVYASHGVCPFNPPRVEAKKVRAVNPLKQAKRERRGKA